MTLSIFLFGVGFGILATGWRLHRQQAIAARLWAEAEARTAQLLAFAPDLIVRQRGDKVQFSGRGLSLIGGKGDFLEGGLADFIAAEDFAAFDATAAVCRFRLRTAAGATFEAEGLRVGPDREGAMRWAIRLVSIPAPAVAAPAPEASAPEAPDVASPPETVASRTLNPQAFSLALFVDECVAAIAPAAAGKHLDIKVELAAGLPVAVLGDEKVLRRLVLRLLDDSVDRTTSGVVSFAIRHAGQGRLRFEAASSQPGDVIAPDGEAENGDPASIATLVAQLGGRGGIGEAGNRWFEIDLPPARPPAVRRKVVDLAGASKPLRILVVEDDALNRELACQMLLARGHVVDMVPDGGEAIMALQQGAYDLVLMDVQMPAVDGLTATQVIRNLGLPIRFTPIVAMTAAVLKQQIQAARGAGMDAVLPKPLSIASLEALLERARRDQVRPPADPGCYEPAVAARLAGSIGAHKVVDMQKLLARTLCARFTQPVSDEAVAALKADAHACIPGAAMLGFTRLSERCRLFIDAEGLDALESTYAALRQDLYNTVRMIDLIVSEDEAEVAA